MRGKYKKPGKFNLLSVIALFTLLAGGYFGYCYFPILMLNAEVKNVMADHLVLFYRANLRPEPQATMQTNDARNSLADKLEKAGLKPKEFEITIKRDQKVVSLDVRYNRTLELVGLDYKKPIEMTPHLETSAAAVTW